MTAAPFTTLVSTADLASHVDDSNWVVLDCRFDLADVAAGGRAYFEGHIPGALYCSLDRDLSGPKSGRNGRHPLPDADALAQTLGAWGIDSSVQVAAYDQDTGMYASRLWWLLRYLGHDRVAVLDGGFAKWTSEHRPVVSEIRPRAPRRFRSDERRDRRMTVEDVERIVRERSSSAMLVDARAPERFDGTRETIDRVAGHIPGARNHFFRNNLSAGGTFLDPGELRARWAASLGSTPPDRAVMYCGSGVTACHNLLALEHAGLRGARLYAGSWSEWTSDPERPIEAD
jgi:thiosulfate/3-mercaptopyruvate sulfurtransferase